MMEFLTFPIDQLLIIAALIEAVTETIKIASPFTYSGNGKYIISVIVGIILAFGMNVSIFTTPGVAYYIGCVMAGVICSRGANYIHAFAKMLQLIPAKYEKK